MTRACAGIVAGELGNPEGIDLQHDSLRLGVIGLGAVGSALKHTLEYNFSNVAGHDLRGPDEWARILECRVVFVCVGTPGADDGRLDCAAVERVIEELDIASFAGVIVVRSTLGVGFLRRTRERFPSSRIVYAPEFLRERSAFQWTVCPDRIVLSGIPADVEEVIAVFQTWTEDAPILIMDDASAEIAKLAHNALIAAKVTFTNQVESICRQTGADPSDVMGVIHADRRVMSTAHLEPTSTPFGGKCVPKDTRELASATEAPLLDTILAFNARLLRDEPLLDPLLVPTPNTATR